MLFNISTQQSVANQSTATYVPQYSSYNLLIRENGMFSKCSQYGLDAYKYSDPGNDTEENDITDDKPTISSAYEYDDQIVLGEEAATRYSERIAIEKIDVARRAKPDPTPGQHRGKVIVDEQDDKKSVHFINLHVPRPPANDPHTRTYITRLIRSLTKFAPAATAFS